MPFDGRDDMALFVADALKTELAENTTDEYHFEMVSGKELELRVTLAWIDPPVTAESAAQLINDLDLTVVGPDRSTEYKMFSGRVDNSNVIERVIVPADTVSENWGIWTVNVSSSGLMNRTQPYSLVVTGPIGASVETSGGGVNRRVLFPCFSGARLLPCWRRSYSKRYS